MGGMTGSSLPAPLRLRRELPLVLVLAGILLWLWPVVFGKSTLFYRDLYVQYIGTSRLLSGEVPTPYGLLWDPYLNGGQTLLGNPNRLVLYPSRLVYTVCDAVTGLNLELLLHFLLGATGMYFLSRRVGPGPWASALAAVGWALGGIPISLTNHLGRFFAFHWLPWAVLATDLALRGTRRRLWWLALTTILAIQWLTGGIEVIVATIVMVAGWAAVHRKRNDRTWWLRVGAVIVAAPILAAVQVLPSAVMVLRSGRTALAGPTAILQFSLHPLRLVELILPGVMGPLDLAETTGRYWGARLVDGGVPYFLTVYLGVTVVLLAFAGLFSHKMGRRTKVFLAGTGALGIAISLGRYLPGAKWVVGVLQNEIIVRFPIKASILAALPMALLAGLGGQHLVDSPRRVRRSWSTFAFAATGVLFLAWLTLTLAPGASAYFLTAYFRGSGPGMAAGVAGAFSHVIMCLGVLAIILLLRNRRWRAPALALLVAADLGAAASQSLPEAPRFMLEAPPPAVTAARRASGLDRFFRGPDPLPLPMHVPADRAWGSAAADLSTLDRYLGTTYGIPMVFHPDDSKLAGALTGQLLNRVSALPLERLGPVLELANVRAILVPGHPDLDWIERAHRIPTMAGIPFSLCITSFPHGFVWFVPAGEHASSAVTTVEAVCQDRFDPRSKVFLASTPSWPRLGFGPSTVIHTESLVAPSRGWAVVSIPWAPGMQASLDGAPRDLSLADGPFMALPVGPGRHSLSIVYRPPELVIGIVLTALSLLVFIVVVVSSFRHPASG